jgi:glyoxylase-like metal-dependent hydrolase (beta-lactamase superfamily II)
MDTNDFELLALDADHWRMDGGVAYGVVPKSLWSKQSPADENNTIAITTRCLLISGKGRRILIDAGLGDKRDPKYYQVRYRQQGVSIVHSLADAGIKPEEITDVLFTHLHDDHVGGATYRDEAGRVSPVFANAEYWVSAAQWDWALNPNKREGAAFFQDNLLPLLETGRLRLLKPDEQPFEHIRLRTFNGHTRGQLIPMLPYRGRTLVYLADFIPTRANIPIPYIPSVDIEPLLSMDEKQAFLAEAVAGNYVLFFEHDADNECCSLIQTEKGIAAGPSFTLSEHN